MVIKKVKKVLPFALASSMILSNIVPVFAESQEIPIEVKGTIQAAKIDVSTNVSGGGGASGSNATYTIDPNNSDGNYLTSSPITIINNSSFPLTISVDKAVNKTNNLEDVLPNDVGDEEDWHNLGKTESESKIALGLKYTDGDYLEDIKSGTVYFKEIQNSYNLIDLGVIESKQDNSPSTVSYEIDGFYGLAFSKDMSEDYQITFNIRLYGSDKEIRTNPNDFTYQEGSDNKIITGYTGNETEIKIPDGVTEITNGTGPNNVMGENITKVILPDSLTKIGPETFYGCKNLKEINIPGNVTEIGRYAFGSCSNLRRSITIPKSVTTIGERAFDSCSNLETVKILNSETSFAKQIFNNCNSLTTIYFNGEPMLLAPYDGKVVSFEE